MERRGRTQEGGESFVLYVVYARNHGKEMYIVARFANEVALLCISLLNT